MCWQRRRGGGLLIQVQDDPTAAVRRIILIGCLLGSGIALAQGVEPKLSDLTEIPLHPGLNHIEGFAQDGRPADILEAWRDNGNAHGYHLFVLTMPSAPGKFDWNVVGTERGDEPLRDCIRDDPHTFEDAVRSIRFAHGRVDGRSATLLLVATRDVSPLTNLAAPVPVTYEAFELIHVDHCCGTADVLSRVLVEHSEQVFSSADLALSQRFGMPLPETGQAAGRR
jgi:hypothetical protein